MQGPSPIELEEHARAIYGFLGDRGRPRFRLTLDRRTWCLRALGYAPEVTKSRSYAPNVERRFSLLFRCEADAVAYSLRWADCDES